MPYRIHLKLYHINIFSDIRPTFLFWARGGPVALLRGANRPLLTRLISEEVHMEVHKEAREHIDIDFYSEKVIQVIFHQGSIWAQTVAKQLKKSTPGLAVIPIRYSKTQWI